MMEPMEGLSCSVSENVPRVFHPRSMRGAPVYDDLSKHELSVSEKTFIGSEAAQMSTFLTWDEDFTRMKLCKRYRLPRTTVHRWMTKVRNSIPISAKVGRPMSDRRRALNPTERRADDNRIRTDRKTHKKKQKCLDEGEVNLARVVAKLKKANPIVGAFG